MPVAAVNHWGGVPHAEPTDREHGIDRTYPAIGFVLRFFLEFPPRHRIALAKSDNGYDNRVAGLDSPSQNRENPPLRFIVLLSRVAGSYGLHVAIVDGLEVKW